MPGAHEGAERVGLGVDLGLRVSGSTPRPVGGTLQVMEEAIIYRVIFLPWTLTPDLARRCVDRLLGAGAS